MSRGMTFKASVSRNACSIPDAIVFAATASPKARALRVTPSLHFGPISRMITAFAMREHRLGDASWGCSVNMTSPMTRSGILSAFHPQKPPQNRKLK